VEAVFAHGGAAGERERRERKREHPDEIAALNKA
jgi:hypothetical protein